MELRSYQESAIEQIVDYAIEHPTGRALLVMPPRSGKTFTGGTATRMFTVDQGLPGLWVAPRVEVLDRTVAELYGCGFTPEQLGVIHAGREATPAAPFQVASEATLSRRNKPPARWVTWDEAHHDAARGRRHTRALYPEAFHLGLTGTPERLTGDLEQDYDVIIAPVEPSELIHDGHLAVPTIYAPEDRHRPSTKGLRVFAGDFAPTDLERLVLHDAALERTLAEWERLAEGRATLGFGVSIAHSRALADTFARRGHEVAHLDGTTAPELRRNMLEELRAGKLAAVFSVGVLSEGFDAPEVKCCIMARPTRSLALFIQQGSRCMTPWEKGTKPRLLDVVGNSFRFGYPWEDRPWKLSRTKRGGGGGAGGQGASGAPMMKRCPSCGAVTHIAAPNCAGCATVFPRVEVAPVDLVRLAEVRWTASAVAKKRAELEAFATSRGFRDGAGWVSRVLAAVVSVGASA